MTDFWANQRYIIVEKTGRTMASFCLDAQLYLPVSGNQMSNISIRQILSEAKLVKNKIKL